MYGLLSHTSVNPAQHYGRKGDTRTGVCCNLFKSLFQKNKEASICNKYASVEEEQKRGNESVSKSCKLLIQLRHSLNNFNIQRSNTHDWLSMF